MQTNNAKLEIAILGAGVAGVATAIALRQRGFNVSIYERYNEPNNMGAGIVVWPNAAFVLDELGLLEEVKAVSGRPTHMKRLTYMEEELGSICINDINEHMGYPSFSILRHDLQRIMLSELKNRGVEVNFNHKVIQLQDVGYGKTGIKFDHGQDLSPDIVIAADGRMASCARRYVLGQNKPVFQGFINWVGICESAEAVVDGGVIMDYWGEGTRFGIVPISHDVAYWAGGVCSNNDSMCNPEIYHDELESLFGEWPVPVLSAIRSTPITRINKIFVHDHDPVTSWFRGNLLMIGDAAHAPLPTSGQGACQALEDAWFLAQYSDGFGDDYQSVFERFVRKRLEKTTSITMAARGFARSLFNPDPHICAQRNARSKQTDYAAMALAMANGWGGRLPLTM